MILTDIKSGDVGLVYVPFKWNNISTYLSAVIRFLINYQYFMRWIFRTSPDRCPVNHAGVFVWERGDLYFYEANERGFIKVLATERFINVDKDCLVVKRYPHANIQHKANTLCENLLGTPYNWLGLVAQIIRQTTFNIIDLEAVKKQSFNRAYCSQIAAYIVYICTNKSQCQYWTSTDPQDLYFDNASKIIPQ